MKIFKFGIIQPLDGIVSIEMAADAKILSCQVQDNLPMIWALVDELKPLVKRKFCIFGTGWPIDANWLEHGIYISTYQLNELVWHLFEDVRE